MITVQIQKDDKTTDFNMPNYRHDEVEAYLERIVNTENMIERIKERLDKAVSMVIDKDPSLRRGEIMKMLEE